MNHKTIADKIRTLADSFAKHYNFEEIEKAHVLRTIADELDPPKPEYEDGDWVEVCGQQYRLLGKTYPLHPESWWAETVYGRPAPIDSSTITRKLDPSEVKIKITLEGIVSRCPLDPVRYFYLHAPHTEKFIALADIDPDTAKTIRELIKAQEEK